MQKFLFLTVFLSPFLVQSFLNRHRGDRLNHLNELLSVKESQSVGFKDCVCQCTNPSSHVTHEVLTKLKFDIKKPNGADESGTEFTYSYTVDCDSKLGPCLKGCKTQKGLFGCSIRDGKGLGTLVKARSEPVWAKWASFKITKQEKKEKGVNKAFLDSLLSLWSEKGARGAFKYWWCNQAGYFSNSTL